MEDKTTYILGEISTMKYGKLPPKQIDKGKYPIWSGYRTVGYCNEFNCAKGDVIIVARGVGGTGDVKIAKENCYLTNLSIHVKLDCNICLPEYFYYRFLLSNLKYLDSGSAQSQITIDDLKRLTLALPPLAQQYKTVNILRSFDNKIELNNQINHNLEEQAQALFSHWLNNCEDKVAISELCDNILDYTPITAKRVVALNSSDVTEGVFAELSYTPISEIKGQFKKRFEKGDILYSEIRPRNLHYAYCYFNPMDYIASTRLMVIRSKSEKLYSSVMLYQYLQMPKVFEEFTSKTESRSGTFPQGNFKDLSSSIVPYSGDNEEISIILESLYKLIWKNIDENKSLSSLRDSLLPILMSGELKINDLTC